MQRSILTAAEKSLTYKVISSRVNYKSFEWCMYQKDFDIIAPFFAKNAHWHQVRASNFQASKISWKNNAAAGVEKVKPEDTLVWYIYA